MPQLLVNVIGSLRLFLNFSGHISVLVPPCERLTYSFAPWLSTPSPLSSVWNLGPLFAPLIDWLMHLSYEFEMHNLDTVSLVETLSTC